MKKNNTTIVCLLLLVLSCFVSCTLSSDFNKTKGHKKRKRFAKNNDPMQNEISTKLDDLNKEIMVMIIARYLPIKYNFTLLTLNQKIFQLLSQNEEFLYYHYQENNELKEDDPQNTKPKLQDLKCLIEYNAPMVLSFKVLLKFQKAATLIALVALTHEGDVLHLGNSRNSKKAPIILLSNVKMITSTKHSLAALTNDQETEGIPSDPHRMLIWSLQNHDFSEKNDRFWLNFIAPEDITEIFSNHSAYASITTEKKVVTAECRFDGGNSSSVRHQLKNVATIIPSERAFAALTEEGNVITWGDAKYGGDSNSVRDKLKNITKIVSTNAAFAALTNEGTVVTWGDANFGGDSTHMKSFLKNIKMIYSTKYAFVALTHDEKAIHWAKAVQNSGSMKKLRHFPFITRVHALSRKFLLEDETGKFMSIM
jgi:hypothetical protein